MVPVAASLSPHALAAILLTLAALYLLSRAELRIEVTSIGILIVAVVAFELFPVPGGLRGRELVAVFGNEALVTICLLLMLARGVEATGALRPVGRALTYLWLRQRSLALLATLVVAAFISAFANNTPIVVMLLPILVGVAHRIGFPPSRILMPVGFATIIGGMSTTIGSSTNLLVVSVAEDLGVPRFGMFDFALPAVVAAGAGLLYLWLVLPRILPDRSTLLEGREPRFFDSVLTIESGSPLAEVTLPQATRLLGEGVRVSKVERGAGLVLARLPTLCLQAGDRLHIRGTPENIRHAHASAGSSLGGADLKAAEDARLIEIVVTPDSPLFNKRLSQLQPGTLRGLTPIGWNRPGQASAGRLDKFTDPLLRTGDVLLMQGPRHDVQQLMEGSRLLVLARALHVPRLSRIPLSLAIVVGVVVTAALGLLPIAASALAGVGLMLATRCLSMADALGAIDTRLALVIAASLALGGTLVGSGAAAWLAQAFVDLIHNWPPPLVLSALLLLAALLTEVVTNNAIAVIGTPIAVGVANELGLPPVPFVLAILFGANISYLTPIGYQTNLLVFGAGGYRFGDFFRGGLPLQILLWVVLSVMLSWLYL